MEKPEQTHEEVMEQVRAEARKALEELSQLAQHPAWLRLREVFEGQRQAAFNAFEKAKSGEELLDLRARWSTLGSVLSWPEREASALRTFLDR